MISLHQALFHWTYVAAGNTTVNAIREYAPLVREWLPKADWPPEGVTLKEPGYLEYTWHGPADFYEFADHRLGGAFEVGKFLAEFVAEHDPKVAGAMLDKLVVSKEPAKEAQKERREREREGQSPDLDNVLTPQAERAKNNGISIAQQKTLDRIARESPDYLPRIAAREISINRAAVELGIVKVKTPLEQAISAVQRLSAEEREILLAKFNSQIN
jgi:hypothetical protein